VVVAVVVATLISAAFGGEDTSSPNVSIDSARGEGTSGPAPTPTATLTRSLPTDTPSPTPVREVTGFAYPLEGACLPEGDNLLPGAQREYRKAIHEGLDFYDADNCTFIGLDTEVLAAKAGTVIRADRAYEDLTAERLAELEELIASGDADDPEIEDTFRGRQVWIDHGDGTVARYAHLDGIADGIDVGVEVEEGELIAYVGDSGTPESVTDPDTEVHLHFEVRVGDQYLGQGRPPDEVRRLYEQAFSH